MVLFREDEQRMKEQERAAKRAKETRLGRALRRCFKIGCWLAAFFAVSLVLLSMLNGSNAALKKGIEDYLSQTTGFPAEISAFNNMSFFPEIALDVGGIVFRKQAGGEQVARIGTMVFRADFFDMMFSRRRMRQLDIHNIEADAGVWGRKALTVDSVTLQKDAIAGKPALILKGKYGGYDMTAHMLVETEEDKFHFTRESRFKFIYGDLLAAGVAERAWHGLSFHLDEAGLPGKTLKGDITLRRRGADREMAGEIFFAHSRLHIALVIGKEEIGGALAFDTLAPDDIAALWALYNKANEYGMFADKTVVIEGRAGAITFPVTIKDGALNIGPAIAADVKLPADSLQIWGKDFAAALQPAAAGGTVTADCLIAAFDVTQKKTIPHPLFIGAGATLVAGEGDVKLAGDTVKASLRPVMKYPESMVFEVAGPLPAENHPCHPYIKAAPVSP